MNKSYSVLGIMSGSSLDGIDLALCRFVSTDPAAWQFQITAAETVSYPLEWLEKLKSAPNLTAERLIYLHAEYGLYLGKLALNFLQGGNLSADFIASHGHTLFHQPENGFTFQLGDGQNLAVAANLPVVHDFRSKDVSFGGQGAPLVPVGDELLFSAFDACLNIGGIANISFREDGQRKAFDICPANQLLNSICRELDLDFDEHGNIARNGSLDSQLMETLASDPYYLLPYPKSISNEYVAEHFLSTIESSTLQPSKKLRTITEHIAQQISKTINRMKIKKVLVTGGGAHNTYLMERLIHLTDAELHIPVDRLVDFKEALVFAFLGVLRWRNEINCLASVTGARRDSSGGMICYP